MGINSKHNRTEFGFVYHLGIVQNNLVGAD